MVEYEKFTLDNGLTLIVGEDRSTPMVAVNTLFDVGSRDENPNRTGFAHLFEHLMFGGTRNVPDYDRVVTEACGESNASTCNDFTQYYVTLPASNLETAFWLESDRMRGLDLSPHSIEVQKSVVCEEYNFRYLNRPYGDIWLLLRPLCYKVHPYRWCTIGADIQHVKDATQEDVRDFFERFYRPNNAVMSVVGNVDKEEVVRLVGKYFGDIESGSCKERHLPQEPEQKEPRLLEVCREVPSDALYMAYRMCGRLDADFPVADLVSDLLSNGNSSRLYNTLYKRDGLFTEIDAYVSAERDPGLFVVAGRLADGVDMTTAQKAVERELGRLVEEEPSVEELRKVQNKYEYNFAFSQYKALDCAMSLCYYEWLGHLDWVNDEPLRYRDVTPADIKRVAGDLFSQNNLSVLRYKRCGGGEAQ